MHTNLPRGYRLLSPAAARVAYDGLPDPVTCAPFEARGWYFEPVDYEGGPYSGPYTSAELARQAAADHAIERELEAARAALR